MDFVTNSILEQKLLRLRTCYIARIVSIDGNTVKIQPLNIIKYSDGSEKIPGQLSGVPMVRSVRNDARAGDLAVCICADRNISAAKRGKMAVPPKGRHSVSDSIIVGLL